MKGKLSTTGQEVSAEIEASLDGATGFLDKIVPAFVKDTGGILNDQVRQWRYLNALRIAMNVKKKIEENNYPVSHVPLKILSPLLESASLEEDKNLKEKWENLLANAVTASKQISPNYVEMLKELSSIEVSILDGLYDFFKNSSEKEQRQMQFDKAAIAKHFNVEDSDMNLIVENLYRLNILQAPAGHGVQIGKYSFVLRTTDIFEITSLGVAFVEACKFE